MSGGAAGRREPEIRSPPLAEQCAFSAPASGRLASSRAPAAPPPRRLRAQGGARERRGQTQSDGSRGRGDAEPGPVPAFPGLPPPAGLRGAGRGAGSGGARGGVRAAAAAASQQRSGCPAHQTRPERLRGRGLGPTRAQGLRRRFLSRAGAARPWRTRKAAAATRVPEVSAGRGSCGCGGAGRGGMRRARPGAPQLPLGKSGRAPLSILPSRGARGSAAAEQGVRGRGAACGPLVTCCAPRLGCGHCGGNRSPCPGALDIPVPGWCLLRGGGELASPGGNQPSVSIPCARCGDARDCRVRGRPPGGPVSPAAHFVTQRGAGGSLGANPGSGAVPWPRRGRAYVRGVGAEAPGGTAAHCPPRPSPGILPAVEGPSGEGSSVPSLPWRGRGRWLPVRRTDARILQMFYGRFLWGAWLGLGWGGGAG